MHILFTIDSLGTGGTETSVLDILQHFPKRHRVSVVYFHAKEDLLQAYQQTGHHVERMPLRNHHDWLQGSARLVEWMKANAVDVAVSTLYEANIITRLAGRKAKVPVVGTFVTDSYGHARRQSFRGIHRLKYYYTWLLDKWTAGIPAAYITNGVCIGQSNARALGIAAQKVVLVYRGRKVEQFAEWAPPENGPFTFCSVARLVPNKGLAELVQAFAAVHASQKNTALLLAGDGPMRPQLEQQVQALGIEHAVVFAGNVPQGWQKLYAAHAFVFPSWFEGFSGALIEAMLTGIPILASNIPMNAEAIRHGEQGMLFEVKNAAALGHAMQHTMQHYTQARHMGQAARNLALTRYDITRVAAQYAEAIEQAIQ